MTLTTPPPSNLGPLSEPWARWQTAQVIQNATAIERLGGDSTNDGIANNSSFDQLASQINELYARQSGLLTLPDQVSAAVEFGNPAMNVFTFQIPRPTDGTRTGWLSAQFTASADSLTLYTDVFGSFSIDGRIFHRDSRYVPTNNLEPTSWNGDKAITGYTGFTLGPNDGGTVTIVAEAIPQGFGLRTVRYGNLQLTYQFGQLV